MSHTYYSCVRESTHTKLSWLKVFDTRGGGSRPLPNALRSLNSLLLVLLVLRVCAEGYKGPARGDVRTPVVVCLQASALLRKRRFAADKSAACGRRKRLRTAPVVRNHPSPLWNHARMPQRSFAAHASFLYSNCVACRRYRALYRARCVEARWRHSCFGGSRMAPRPVDGLQLLCILCWHVWPSMVLFCAIAFNWWEVHANGHRTGLPLGMWSSLAEPSVGWRWRSTTNCIVSSGGVVPDTPSPTHCVLK